ncbi:MFS transporter [Fodinisporobacter ferrooxydans]|uniref:MFS transporter n=1 Tax=Fodinisporobacter ferrooxydans TaxID=2901836 RepID=A0ABY4CMX3_9BACL|nr:MFS transporter [Alicyclobacillaceae bacterium MYW30-H2]
MKDHRLVLGLRPNLAQFILLAVNNVFVGTMVGLERTVLPILGKHTFHLTSVSLLLSFIVSFGIVKGFLNLIAGKLADRWGRKPVLLAGWLLGLPVPLLVIFAPDWSWIIFANILLGANQGFAWSMTVTGKIDIVGPTRRGLALGINEFSGYIGVALTSAATGYLASAYGPRPVPFLFGEGIAVIGLLMAWLMIRETLPYTRLEIAKGSYDLSKETLSLGQIFAKVSFQDRTLFACSQAGMINKFSDSAVWGLVPVIMAAEHFTVAQIGMISSVYAMTWGVFQLFTGMWSDHVGRKIPIALGQLINGIGVALVLWAHAYGMWFLSALLMGAGTALIYPVLLSAVGDKSHPAWRGSALGVYRMWRDGGYAIGGLLLGFGADFLGIHAIFAVLAAIVILSSLLVIVFMKETLGQH